MIGPVELPQVLDPEYVTLILQRLASMKWHDGKATAGALASEVKHNKQVNEKQSESLRASIAAALLDSTLLSAMVRPRDFLLMFSRYEEGDEYGLHVDSATVGTMRRDVSFTLFLTPPTDYVGGELVIESPLSEKRYKCEAGSMLLYPATSLHRVTRIEHGTRIVIVGWIRSYVRDAAKRELLFELDAVKSALYDTMGKSNEVDVLSKVSANLMRMWMDD